MSADNYYLIRKDGDKFVATMGFASDAVDPPIHAHDRRFDTVGEAEAWAHNEFTEYGVFMGAYHDHQPQSAQIQGWIEEGIASRGGYAAALLADKKASESAVASLTTERDSLAASNARLVEELAERTRERDELQGQKDMAWSVEERNAGADSLAQCLLKDDGRGVMGGIYTRRLQTAFREYRTDAQLLEKMRVIATEYLSAKADFGGAHDPSKNYSAILLRVADAELKLSALFKGVAASSPLSGQAAGEVKP